MAETGEVLLSGRYIHNLIATGSWLPQALPMPTPYQHNTTQLSPSQLPLRNPQSARASSSKRIFYSKGHKLCTQICCWLRHCCSYCRPKLLGY